MSEEEENKILDQAYYWNRLAQKYAGIGAFSLFNQCWTYYIRKMSLVSRADEVLH